MKTLLRSCFIVESSDRLDLFAANYQALAESGLGVEVPEDDIIWKYIQDFFSAHGHVPSIQSMNGHFTTTRQLDVVDRLERLAMNKPRTRGDFANHLEVVLEQRRQAAAIALAKEMAQIASDKLEVVDAKGKTTTLRGALDAIAYVMERGRGISGSAAGRIFETAADVVEEEQAWLWNGYVAQGELTLCEGPQHSGKSTMLTWLAAAVTTGSPFPGEVGGQDVGDVVWISTEEKASTQIIPRLRLAGADLSRVHIVKLNATWTTAKLRELELLIETHGVRMIVIDALKDVLGRYDDWKETEVRKALRPLVDLAHKHGVAIVGVRHWRKSSGHARDRGAGSMAYGALARGILVVGPHEGLPHVAVAKAPGPAGVTWSFAITPVVEDGRRSPIPQLTWTGPRPDVLADHLATAQPETSEESSAKGEAVEFLEQLLRDVPMPAADVVRAAERAGIKAATLRRARATCCRPGTGGPQSMWELRDAPAPKPVTTNAINLDDDEPPAARRSTTMTPASQPMTRAPTIRELLERVEPPTIPIIKGTPPKVHLESMRSAGTPIEIDVEVVELPRADGRVVAVTVGPWERLSPDEEIADIIAIDHDLVANDVGGVVRGPQGYGLSEAMLAALGHAVGGAS